jgi:hypothetical protein
VTCSKAPNNLISKEEYEKFLKEEEAKHWASFDWCVLCLLGS